MAKWMTDTSEDDRKKQMDQMMTDWKSWAAKLGSAIVDQGKPLGKTKRVTKAGVTDEKNDLNYYLILQAESHDAAAKMMSDCPHFMIPDSYAEVMEISHMGM